MEMVQLYYCDSKNCKSSHYCARHRHSGTRIPLGRYYGNFIPKDGDKCDDFVMQWREVPTWRLEKFH